MAKAKTQPTEIKITGSTQAAQLKNAFDSKKIADKADANYKNARLGVLPLVLSKVFNFWKKKGEPVTGAYNFTAPEGTFTFNIQNRQSSKVYDPKGAKELLDKLNANVPGNTKLKAADVYDIVTEHHINPRTMQVGKIREKILEVLTKLEADLKKDGTLTPENSIIVESKTLILAEHAIPRILALTENFETAMSTLDNPISANFVFPKEDK